MKIVLILLALVLGMTLLPGGREKSQISSRVVVTAIGIDAPSHTDAEVSGCQLSIQAVEALKTAGNLSEQEDNATAVYHAQGDTISGALGRFVTAMGRDTYLLHNQVVAVGMKQARKQSLDSLLDYFVRSHTGRPAADMIIARDSAAAVLEVPSVSFTLPSEQISLLLKEGQYRGEAVRTRLLDVERAVSGMFDAVIPIVRVQGEGETRSLLLDGTACFRDGVYAGELDSSGTRGLLYALNEMSTCDYTLEVPSLGRITTKLHDSSTRIAVSRDGDKPVYTLRIQCGAEIAEEVTPQKTTVAYMDAIRTQLKAHIEADVNAFLQTAVREYGCDAPGFARRTKKEQPALIRGREATWRDVLRRAQFTVEVAVSLDQLGAQAL